MTTEEQLLIYNIQIKQSELANTLNELRDNSTDIEDIEYLDIALGIEELEIARRFLNHEFSVLEKDEVIVTELYELKQYRKDQYFEYLRKKYNIGNFPYINFEEYNVIINNNQSIIIGGGNGIAELPEGRQPLQILFSNSNNDLVWVYPNETYATFDDI